ncbi:hypothetical protein ACFL40_01680 [candidate division KSB1 bacterium]
MLTNPFRANGWSADKVYTAVQQPQETKTIQSLVKEETPLEKVPEKTVEKNNTDTFTKSIYKPTIDISAVQLDLNLEFNADSLKSTLDNIIGKEGNQSSDKKTKGKSVKKKAEPFLSVGLSANAVGVEMTKVSGSGKAREIDVRYRRRSVNKESSDYRLDNIRMKISRRRREEVDARLQVRYRNGYRIVRRKIAQRYREDVSVQADLLRQFDNTTQKVAENKPEDTGKFLKTTDRLVSNKKVKAKTVSKFFDVVESYVDKTRKALHSKIDRFLDKIADNFNVDKEKLNEMKANLHNKVDSFFDNVNNTLDKLEGDAISFIAGSTEQKAVEGETAVTEEQPAEREPVDVVA